MKTSSFEWGRLTGALRRRRGVAFLTLLVVFALGAAAWAGWPRSYHATFSLELLQEGGEEGPPGETGRLRELLFAPRGDVTQEYITLLRRHDVVEYALTMAGVIDQTTPPDLKDYLVYRLRKDISFERENERSTNITVYVRADSPGDAEKLARGVLDGLERAEEDSRTQRLKDTKNQLETTLAGAREHLEGRRSLLRHFEEVDKIEAEIRGLREAIAEDQRKIEAAAADRRAARRALLNEYTEDWYEVRALDSEISFLDSFEADGLDPAADERAEVGEKLKTWRWQYQALKDRLKDRLEDFDGAMIQAWEKAGSRYQSLAALSNDLRRAQENIAVLQRDINRYSNSIAASAKRHRILKDPVAPRYPSSPDSKMLAIWFGFLGVIFAALVVYLLEMTDATANSPSEIQQAADADTLAVIPHMDGAMPRTEGFPLVFGPRGEPLPYAESFRTLKSNVLFSIPNVPSPAVLVTSSDREEGKSTTVLNLALACAEDRKTLLIGCNMRRPTLHKPLGISEQIGMTDILEGNVRWEDAVRRTRYPNLYFIPHGRIAVNSSVLLGRPAFAEMLKEARQAYDMILIDSPPAALLIDATVIATKADATVLVYSLGETNKEMLRRTLEVLRKVDANVIGVAANSKMSTSHRADRYYDYHQQERQ